ncbi:MAG: flippase-like domain-containing protein [Verrucomicrobia bacterium]|nr:flippase-like domain-containing protein [Verrucomicrobiota bacterium]
MKVAIRVILLLLGVALFAWFVQRAGPGEIWKTCLNLGWYAPLTLIPYGIVYFADTMGWKFAFASRALKGIGFWTLYRVRWCGEAVNNVVPSAYVGGEAVKVYLMHKRGADAGDVAASVIIGRSMQTLTQVMFIALGSAAFLTLAPADSGVRTGLLVVLAGSVLAVAVLFWLQTRGLFSMIFRAVEMFGMKLEALEAKRTKLKRIDELVVEFYRKQRGRVAASGGGYLCGWLLDTMDIFLVSWLVGMPITWTQALAIEAFIGVAKVLGLFVPGAIGVQESGIALVCRLAGLPDALGLSYAIIRRGREVVYASIGWLLLYAEEASLKGISGRIAAETRTEL